MDLVLRRLLVPAAVMAFVGTVTAPARAATPGASARTVYVSVSGSDAAAGDRTTPMRTLTKALARAVGGERIVIEAGSYPAARDTRARAKPVAVVGAGTSRTTVRGLEVLGGQRLVVSGIKFAGPVKLGWHPTLFSKQRATSVTIDDSEITAPASNCVVIRDGATAITLQRNRIHDCATGVGGPFTKMALRSSGVVVDGNTIERVSADAVQFGSWDNVTITRNTIRDVRDPGGVVHNDGVQVTGAARHVQITRNRISGSSGQLILIQDAMAPVDDVRVDANLLWDAAGVAIQSAGVTRARFVNNTVWNARSGGLWLWPGMGLGGNVRTVPTDTLVANNMLPSFFLKNGANVGTSVGNVVQCGTQPMGTPPGVTCVKVLGYIDPAAGDLRLAASAPERRLGSELVSAGTDIDGIPYVAPVVPGAHAG